jgi:ATP phosphoribosyltransferase regulatory subunit
MNDGNELALLPNGLNDTLMPDAAIEAAMVARLLERFERFGYELVKPPLAEFEDSLLDGPGSALAPQMFRVMDPVTQRMMGLRPDITPQIARIATSRLSNAPRPVRLSYAGPVLQVKGSQLRPEREVTQVGIELIGSPALQADAEVIIATAEALAAIGVQNASFDLTLPRLVTLLCSGMELGFEITSTVRAALDRKDAGALHKVPALLPEQRETFEHLLSTAGVAETSLAALQKMSWPPAARAQVRDLVTVVKLVHEAVPQLKVTVDPVEFRGLEYQTGVSFTIFARGVTGELGRGGRYVLSTGETATGATLFMESLLQAAVAPARPKVVYLPFGTGAAERQKLHAEGWHTRAALAEEADARGAAKAQGCTHIFTAGRVEAVG